MGLQTHTVFAAFVQARLTAQTLGMSFTAFPSCTWPSKTGDTPVSLSQMSGPGPHSGSYLPHLQRAGLPHGFRSYTGASKFLPTE